MSMGELLGLVTIAITGAGMVYKLGKIHQSSESISKQVNKLAESVDGLIEKHDDFNARLTRVEAWQDMHKN